MQGTQTMFVGYVSSAGVFFQEKLHQLNIGLGCYGHVERERAVSRVGDADQVRADFDKGLHNAEGCLGTGTDDVEESIAQLVADAGGVGVEPNVLLDFLGARGRVPSTSHVQLMLVVFHTVAAAKKVHWVGERKAAC